MACPIWSPTKFCRQSFAKQIQHSNLFRQPFSNNFSKGYSYYKQCNSENGTARWDTTLRASITCTFYDQTSSLAPLHCSLFLFNSIAPLLCCQAAVVDLFRSSLIPPRMIPVIIQPTRFHNRAYWRTGLFGLPTTLMGFASLALSRWRNTRAHTWDKHNDVPQRELAGRGWYAHQNNALAAAAAFGKSYAEQARYARACSVRYGRVFVNDCEPIGENTRYRHCDWN